MGKKSKKKTKKVSAKKEKYAKFRKEKPGVINIDMPDLDDGQMKQKRTDEEKIGKYLRFNRNKPPKEVIERKEKSKR